MEKNYISDETLKEMEQYCKARFQKKFFIKDEMYISSKAFETLKSIKEKTSIYVISECIEASPQRSKLTFYVELKCDSCGAIINKKLTKTKFIEALSNKGKYLCEECQKRKEEKNAEEQAKIKKEYEQRKIQKTKIFIQKALNPDFFWAESIPKKRYYTVLREEVSRTNEKEVADYIKNMPYKDFLQTPYWEAVANRKRYKANFKCELCNNTGLLNVHHKSYKNHGYEVDHLEDLIVLCEDCHKKFHDIVS